MTAGRYDITLDQGTTFERTLVWTDAAGGVINLTGYSALMQLRRSSSSAVVELELASPDSITLGADGSIALELAAVTTADLFGAYSYDLRLTSPGGEVTRLVEGVVTVSPAVSR